MERGLRSLAGGLLVVVGLVVSFLGVVPGLGAVADAVETPAPVSDYAAYPEAVDPVGVPDHVRGIGGRHRGGGCDVLGERRRCRSRSRDDRDTTPGQVVTMTWSGFAAGCEGSGVSLSFRRADAVVPDPTSNLELVTRGVRRTVARCRRPVSPGADGRFVLSVVTPPRQLACNFQVDAVVGPALAGVGPAGSFYDAGLRSSVLGQVDPGRSTVIGSFTGGSTDCGAPDPAVTPVASCTGAASSCSSPTTVSSTPPSRSTSEVSTSRRSTWRRVPRPGRQRPPGSSPSPRPTASTSP